MKRIISLSVAIILLFSSLWASAALNTPKKIYYWNFVWELKYQDHPKKTVFLMQDEGWSVFQVFSSRLAPKIRDLFFRWSRVKVEWQDYYAKNWFFAWIFLSNIENTEVSAEVETRQVQQLSATKKLIAYVYSRFVEADKLNKLSWIFWWNNVSVIADEAEEEFLNNEIDYNLYSLIKSLLTDKQIQKSTSEYCVLSNWKSVYDNLNPNLKTLIDWFSNSDLEDVVDWKNLNTPEKGFIYEHIKSFSALKQYLVLINNINFLQEELWDFWILNHQIDIISSISWIEMNIDRLKFLVLNDFYLTSVVWALDDLSWISSNSFFKYVLSRIKQASLEDNQISCEFNDWVLEKFNTRIEMTDFNSLIEEAYWRDLSLSEFDWIKIKHFENFQTIDLVLAWERFIRVFPWNYNPNFALHINIWSLNELDWETCTKTWDIRFSWMDWWQFVCVHDYNNLSKQWYFWDKIIRKLYSDDWRVVEIFYYKNGTVLDNLFEEIIAKMEIDI